MIKKALSVFFALALCQASFAKESSTIELNGEVVEVYFNDGDTFRVLSGSLAGKRSRLEGFNTLESYGAVHRWGEFTKKELLANAKEATKNARRGGWHCTTDLSMDTYGRILSKCFDLAVDQISKGLAHVMTLDDTPGDPALLEVQSLAIKEARGMWEKGAPEFVITSVHSVNESAGQTSTYNRLVSIVDGHSELEIHSNDYRDCEEICTDFDSQNLQGESISSCMTYVNYKNRFGPRMARCLR